jgi:medium-chain acyl-[acyl-carrier-protein] hydrolase
MGVMTLTRGAPQYGTDVWFDRRFRSATARYSLYCFPFAGGSATYYSYWGRYFRDQVEMVPVQLPARGPRMAEPSPTSIVDISDEVVAHIASAHTVPLLFGHSMGAILAFEVARRLEAIGRPPTYLFVSGRPAPPQARPVQAVSRLPREQFVQVLREYGAADEEILANNELLEVLLPMIRADFAMIENYQYQPGRLLHCPIFAWCGTDDPEVDPTAIQGWAEETRAGLGMFVRSGGHFFLSHHVEEIARIVHDAVSRAEASCTAPAGLMPPVDHGRRHGLLRS